MSTQSKFNTLDEALENFNALKETEDYICIIKSIEAHGKIVYYVENAPSMIRTFEILVHEVDKES